MKTLSRCGSVLLLIVFLSACSSFDRETASASSVSERQDDCAWNRSSCLYEGRYDVGERDYAEEEAKRLNRAQLNRLRRMGG